MTKTKWHPLGRRLWYGKQTDGALEEEEQLSLSFSLSFFLSSSLPVSPGFGLWSLWMCLVFQEVAAGEEKGVGEGVRKGRRRGEIWEQETHSQQAEPGRWLSPWQQLVQFHGGFKEFWVMLSRSWWQEKVFAYFLCLFVCVLCIAGGI